MVSVPDNTRRRLSEAREVAARRVVSLERQFEEIVFAATDVATDDEHDPEGHTIAWERQQVAAILAKAKADLAAIDAALGRLEDGNHGRCSICGDAIGAARLEALPEVETCIGCAR